MVQEVAQPDGDPSEPEGPEPDEPDVALDELPPSAQTVYEVLNEEGPATHKELLTEMEMPGRTIRYAVKRLKEAGIIGERCKLMDCRQCYFFVQNKCPGKPEYRKTRGS